MAASSKNGQHLAGINIPQIQMNLETRRIDILSARERKLGEAKHRPTGIYDLADHAAENLRVGLTLADTARLSKELQDINEALDRIRHDTFGICNDCGEPIAAIRINSNNCAISCITCEEKKENAAKAGSRGSSRIAYLSL